LHRPSYRPRLEELEKRLVPITSVNDLTTLTVSDLITNLVGPNVRVSNVTYTGADKAAGIFSGGSNSVGIGSGVVLSTGSAINVAGPWSSTVSSVDNNQASDPSLDQIATGSTNHDAAVLQFDFVPQGNVLAFKYVFGSDEYNTPGTSTDFVGSQFNDVFAFFLNGKNVALLPGTTTPVSINNVNDGNSFNSYPAKNPQYYIDNSTGTYNTQMNGFTKVLSVVLPVNPGQTYHIKLAIEDVNDALLDSWVLIQAGSFSTVNVKTYRPLRYTYNPVNQTFNGDVTVTNTGSQNLSGPLFLVFPHLPTGSVLVNATGKTPKGSSFVPSGIPYIKIPGGLKAGQSVHVSISLTDPNNVNLGTFFLNYPMEITGAF
jgi:hypothetical protein